MKIISGIKFLKIGEVAKLLGKTPQTIRLWYKFKDERPEIDTNLPDFYELDNRGSRFFMKDDMPKLYAFRDAIIYGGMSDFNEWQWGLRRLAIKNKVDKTKEFYINLLKNRNKKSV